MKKGIYKICPTCHKRFYISPYYINKTTYCCRKCADKGRKKGIYKTCPVCKKKFYVFPHLVNEQTYCSQKCSIIAKREKLKPSYYNRHFRKGKYKICEFCGKPYYCEKYRIDKSFFCSRSCAAKFKNGEKASNWQGGKTTKNMILRNRIEYHLWRKKVFERDNYTCQDCDKRGCELNAHHVKSFSEYPELRLDITNGVTLCKECHQKRHTTHS